MSCLKVICWALIFIFKLRFLPGVSIATVLVLNYSQISKVPVKIVVNLSKIQTFTVIFQ
jgi:hypothetical protein